MGCQAAAPFPAMIDFTIFYTRGHRRNFSILYLMYYIYAHPRFIPCKTIVLSLLFYVMVSTSFVETRYGGFHKWGIQNGWFISSNIPSRNGWWLGVPLWLRKPLYRFIHQCWLVISYTMLYIYISDITNFPSLGFTPMLFLWLSASGHGIFFDDRPSWSATSGKWKACQSRLGFCFSPCVLYL